MQLIEPLMICLPEAMRAFYFNLESSSVTENVVGLVIPSRGDTHGST